MCQVVLTRSGESVSQVYMTHRQQKLTWGVTRLQNRLRVLRAERGWSQAELGGRIGVSRQAVNAIETGKHDPSLPLAFRLARLFGTSIEEIFNDGEG
jgi:putative transcriptional regulator